MSTVEPFPDPWKAKRQQSRLSRPENVEGVRVQMQYIGVDGERYGVELDPYETPKSRFCAYLCCPCCLGSPFVGEQRRQYLNCLSSFTLWLFVVQVAMFIASCAVGGFAPLRVNPLLGPCPAGLFYCGAMNPYLAVKEWQLYRFVVPVFLHGGVIHLALNAFGELRFGLYFERRTGLVRTLLLYLLGTIGGCLLSALIQKPGQSAIFAVFLDRLLD